MSDRTCHSIHSLRRSAQEACPTRHWYPREKQFPKDANAERPNGIFFQFQNSVRNQTFGLQLPGFPVLCILAVILNLKISKVHSSEANHQIPCRSVKGVACAIFI